MTCWVQSNYSTSHTSGINATAVVKLIEDAMASTVSCIDLINQHAMIRIMSEGVPINVDIWWSKALSTTEWWHIEGPGVSEEEE